LKILNVSIGRVVPHFFVLYCWNDLIGHFFIVVSPSILPWKIYAVLTFCCQFACFICFCCHYACCCKKIQKDLSILPMEYFPWSCCKWKNKTVNIICLGIKKVFKKEKFVWNINCHVKCERRWGYLKVNFL
jgi:hypothetical protein